MPKINVSKQEDWLQIAALAGPVVDPLILRCGDLFLRGAAGISNANAAWDFLTRNIHALGTFFDRLVIDERIPVFDYADSFDLGMNFEDRTLTQVNAADEILVEVHVAHERYMETKRAALGELQKLYAGTPRVDAGEANNILGELTASGYEWYPQLEGLALPNEAEERLAAYMLGGLVFGAYAQQAGADHLMQPKRSRLFLAISLGDATDRRFEDALFGKLSQVSGRPTAEVPYTPTFFPYLLARSQGPRDVLKNVLEMRRSSEVRDYREWLRDAMVDFQTNGRIATGYKKDVATIAAAVAKKLEGGQKFPKVDVKAVVTDVAEGNPKKAALGAAAGLASALWGFVVDQLPGKRHRKLLTRALVADAEYIALDNAVRAVWSGPGFPS